MKKKLGKKKMRFQNVKETEHFVICCEQLKIIVKREKNYIYILFSFEKKTGFFFLEFTQKIN